MEKKIGLAGWGNCGKSEEIAQNQWENLRFIGYFWFFD
jgi:hypothetical protein